MPLRQRQKLAGRSDRKSASTQRGSSIGQDAQAIKSRTWLKGIGALIALAGLLSVAHLVSDRASVLDPFPGTPLKELPQFKGQHAEQLLWGTYRPGYYFGMRMRRPQSLLFGLMWLDPQRLDPLGNIRHEARQGDGLAKYGWIRHDGRTHGVQELWDQQLNITTAWAKHMRPSCGSGGDWGVSVVVADRSSQTARRKAMEQADNDEQHKEQAAGEEQPAKQKAVSLFFYMAAEDGGHIQLDIAAAAAALQSGAGQAPLRPVLSGSTQAVRRWQLHLRSFVGGGGKVLSVNYLAVATPHLHNLTDLVREGVLSSVRQQYAQGQRQYRLVLPDTVHPRSNVAIVQVTALLPLSLDLSFVGGLTDGLTDGMLAARVDAVSGSGLQHLLATGDEAFEQQFATTFGTAAGSTSIPAVSSGTAATVARAALSNMLGGIGYFFGHSLVRTTQQQHSKVVQRTAKLWDTALYSAVPSRSFFPRGFLWDEGFHQLLIRRWDAAISRDILGHWFDLMNSQGWIAREQILGEEARARVPAEYVQQAPDAANPPTFFLLLSDMSQRVAAAAKAGEWDAADLADAEFLKAAWPRLRAWYMWFNSTQAGPVPGSYRWRGREGSSQRELNPKTLTSGLDDAPRASHPSDDERHLDLRCWMALATRALAVIGSNLGLPSKQVQPFFDSAAWLEDFDQLNALHWDEASGEYRDWGSHTEDMALQQPTATLSDGRQVPVGEMQRVQTGQPPRLQLVPQFGYIGLFPLLMRLIPPSSPVLGRQLLLLRDTNRLWTDHGLRSLSQSASLYQQRNTEHDPPYWRGAIWINVNYVAVQALQHYGSLAGPYQLRAAKLHQELRRNLVQNIVKEYDRTGYLWEQYDDITGQGKGSHPFTGWTALLALMTANDL
ncbi:Mannosyl-oligosaccharide glucosidase GCS1 [Chlorella vulgaris]